MIHNVEGGIFFFLGVRVERYTSGQVSKKTKSM